MKSLKLLSLGFLISCYAIHANPEQTEILRFKEFLRLRDNLTIGKARGDQRKISKYENELVGFFVRHKTGQPCGYAARALESAKKTDDKSFVAYTAMSLAEKFLIFDPFMKKEFLTIAIEYATLCPHDEEAKKILEKATIMLANK